jgi:AraC-like DNA-binding protein
MNIEYHEWMPCAALNGVILAYWRVAGDGTSVPSPTILPDAYVEIVVNLGGAVSLDGRPFTGSQPARAVVGLLDTAIEMRYPPDVCTFGIRLHPARAATFLGVPTRALMNTVSPLGQLSPQLDEELSRVTETYPRIASSEGRDAVESVLLAHLRRAPPTDDLIVRAVDHLLAADAPLAVADLATTLGVSPRQVHRRFLAEVGVSPKRLERLARFARAWRQAVMGPRGTWADLALANGYADQSHLVREFRTFGARPPAHLFTAEWYEATTVTRGDSPPSDVRSVPDRPEQTRHDRRRREKP